MAESDDIETRVSALEREIALLRERIRLARDDAGAARTLVSGADRDVAEMRAQLRAHTQVLNALRATQLEMMDGQLEMRGEMNELRGEMNELRDEMRGGFATVHAGMAQITGLLSTIIGPEPG
jgi:chromosome segregation ATPase